MADFLLEHWFLSALLGILGTILLGALGSALWDVALRPASRKLGTLLFTLLTLGAKRARDGIYREAARGHHELPALFILAFVIIAIATAGIIISALGVDLLTGGSVATYRQELVSTCISEIGTSEPIYIRTCLQDKRMEQFGTYIPFLILILIFSTIRLLYQFMRINAINLTITYFEQCIRVLGPFLPTKDRRQLEQAFALMESKEAFEELVKELKRVAEANGVRLPKPYY